MEEEEDLGANVRVTPRVTAVVTVRAAAIKSFVLPEAATRVWTKEEEEEEVSLSGVNTLLPVSVVGTALYRVRKREVMVEKNQRKYPPGQAKRKLRSATKAGRRSCRMDQDRLSLEYEHYAAVG